MGGVKTLEQKRAEHALETVPGDEQEEKFRSSYRSYVERFATAVLTNGLGQALASELAAAGPNPTDADKRAHKQLYENVASWLKEQRFLGTDEDLLKKLVEAEQDFYISAQAEVLAWLTWHKKFCQAYLPRSEEGQ